MAERKKKARKAKTTGRPSKYQEEYAEQAKKLCLLKRGITDKQVADFFGVSVSTLNLWKKDHQGFSEALKGGRVGADAEVANSLYQQALKGNVTAAIFWLKNRQSDSWRDVKQSENVTYEATPEDRMAAAAYGMGLTEFVKRRDEGTLPKPPELPEPEAGSQVH